MPAEIGRGSAVGGVDLEDMGAAVDATFFGGGGVDPVPGIWPPSPRTNESSGSLRKNHHLPMPPTRKPSNASGSMAKRVDGADEATISAVADIPEDLVNLTSPQHRIEVDDRAADIDGNRDELS